MSASDNLSVPLFHGTAREIEGGKVLPANQGIPGEFSDTGSRDVAFASPHEDTAWSFAAWNNPRNLRTRVYTVTPGPNLQSQAENPKLAPYEVTADHFNITGQIDIKPGRQGTLPINWAEKADNPNDADRLNHPDWDDPSLSGEKKEHPRVRTRAGLQAERDWLKSIGKKNMNEPKKPLEPPRKKSAAQMMKERGK